MLLASTQKVKKASGAYHNDAWASKPTKEKEMKFWNKYNNI